MIIPLMITILSTFLVATLGVVLATIIKIRLALKKFLSKSRGIPLADDFRPITSHIISLIFKPDLQNHLRKLFSKHGDTFLAMYGEKPFVFTTDLDLIKTMALEEQQVNINRTRLEIPCKEVEQDSIMLAGGEQWRRTRRAIAPALRKAKFMAPNVQREIDNSISKFIDSLERKLNQNEANRIGYIKLDADEHFHSQHDKMTQILELGFSEVLGNPFFYMPIVFPILGPFLDSYLLKYFKFGTLRELILNFIKLQTRQNLEARKEIQSLKQEGRQDINEDNLILKDGTKFNRNMIDDVIDHYHDGKISKREYFHSSFFLLAAADKTSADALSQTIYRLALDKDRQNKLRESIRSEGEESEYLAWVIWEALRLQPPVTIGCSRTVERDIETSSGALIPKGSFVITPSYVIHRLEKYWGEDVDAFRPERFAERKSFHPCQFIPFGAGLRQCPGKEFALHEMKRLLSKLISRYEFTCERKKNEAFDTPFFVYIIQHEPILVQITRLGNSCNT